MTLKVVLSAVLGVLLSIGSGVAAEPEKASDQQRFDKQIQKGGDEMGVPTPGSVADQETTKKKRNPSRQQSAEQNAQVTMGGAQYFVYGDVLKIEGDSYFIKDEESGDEVKLIVNQDTNLDCAVTPTSGGSMATDRPGEQSTGSTKRQQAQGQRKDETATGSGFSAGKCAFQPGDKVKAEVSDLGTVTTLKLMMDKPSKSAGSFESQITQAPGTATGKDTAQKSPKIKEVPGMKQDMAGAVAPPDLRPEGQQQASKSEGVKEARIGGCPPEDGSVKGEVFRGKVVSVDNEFVIAKDKAGKERKLHVDRCTQTGEKGIRAEPFKQGDRIEAYLAPNGHAMSISLMKGSSHLAPGDPESGG
jgi:hypothetical protein